MRDENPCELEDETIAAINEGELQADQGLGEDLDSFRIRMERWMQSNSDKTSDA